VDAKFAKNKNESLTSYRNRIKKDFEALRSSHNGQKLFVCPSTYTSTNCASCAACASLKPNETVCFPAHGSKRNSIMV